MENLYSFPIDQTLLFINNLITSLPFLIALGLAALVGIRSLLCRQRYYGGSRVKGGLYWNPREWTIKPIIATGGILAGDKSTQYHRVPMLPMLLIVPLLGLLYVILLPFVGLGMLIKCIAQRLYRLGHKPSSIPESLPLSINHNLGVVYPDGGLPAKEEEQHD